MNDAKPRPNSNNPEFITNWLEDGTADYEGVSTTWTEQQSESSHSEE